MSFDAVAPWYRTLETIAFGNALQRARVACLDEIGSPRRALNEGEGNGRFLCELLRKQPGIEVDYADASARMLDLARRRIQRAIPEAAGRVRFLHRDITSWAPEPKGYDLIVTHFFLDCFPADQLGAVVRKLSQAAAADAIWLLADFRMPPEPRSCLTAKMWLRAMYLFFRVTARIEARKLIDPSPFLRAEGFSLVQQHLSRHGMLKSQMWRRHGSDAAPSA
ncbi:MAG: class I SAM-dependent methyltransferase [Chthoniobacterales bacterium]